MWVAKRRWPSGGRWPRSAADHQVLVVTHLPQVAAFADHQMAVTKVERDGRTVATSATLEQGDRVVELSRMLSGQPSSATPGTTPPSCWPPPPPPVAGGGESGRHTSPTPRQPTPGKRSSIQSASIQSASIQRPQSNRLQPARPQAQRLAPRLRQAWGRGNGAAAADETATAPADAPERTGIAVGRARVDRRTEPRPRACSPARSR